MIPIDWALHGRQKAKADRGITRAQSLLLYEATTFLVPVASPICKSCRLKVAELVTKDTLQAELITDATPTEVQEDIEVLSQPISDAEEKPSTGDHEVESLCVEFETSLHITSTERSIYNTESSDSTAGSNGDTSESNLISRRSKLNNFLLASGRESVKQPKKKWEYSSMRTRKTRISTAKDAVVASLEVISPDDPGSLWLELISSHSVERALGLSSTLTDETYQRALAETYENTQSWHTRRQVLSIMADLVPMSTIQQYIPGVTEYCIKAARKHTLKYGREDKNK